MGAGSGQQKKKKKRQWQHRKNSLLHERTQKLACSTLSQVKQMMVLVEP